MIQDFSYPQQVVLALQSSANQRSAREIGVYTPCGGVSTRGTAAFVPSSLELQMYRRISDAGVEPYSPWLRRNLDVPPRGNFRRASHLSSMAEGG